MADDKLKQLNDNTITCKAIIILTVLFIYLSIYCAYPLQITKGKISQLICHENSLNEITWIHIILEYV